MGKSAALTAGVAIAALQLYACSDATRVAVDRSEPAPPEGPSPSVGAATRTAAGQPARSAAREFESARIPARLEGSLRDAVTAPEAPPVTVPDPEAPPPLQLRMGATQLLLAQSSAHTPLLRAQRRGEWLSAGVMSLRSESEMWSLPASARALKVVQPGRSWRYAELFPGTDLVFELQEDRLEQWLRMPAPPDWLSTLPPSAELSFDEVIRVDPRVLVLASGDAQPSLARPPLELTTEGALHVERPAHGGELGTAFVIAAPVLRDQRGEQRLAQTLRLHADGSGELRTHIPVAALQQAHWPVAIDPPLATPDNRQLISSIRLAPVVPGSMQAALSLTWAEPATGQHLLIDWDDGTPVQTQAAQGAEALYHHYAAPGVYSVGVAVCQDAARSECNTLALPMVAGPLDGRHYCIYQCGELRRSYAHYVDGGCPACVGVARTACGSDDIFGLGCPLGRCGDGVVDDGEACDDGNDDNDDACTNACALAACGDGFVQAPAGEVCDDGNTASGDGCRGDCGKVEICGDGLPDAGEACDDGNADNSDACTQACALAACGDGFVQAGELCDDGNDVDTDRCLSSCCWSNHALLEAPFNWERSDFRGGYTPFEDFSGCEGDQPFFGFHVDVDFTGLSGPGGAATASVIGSYTDDPVNDPRLGRCDIRMSRSDACAPWDMVIDACDQRPGFEARALLELQPEGFVQGHYGNDKPEANADACGRIAWFRVSCGDGTVQLGEACDDGNGDDTDGCTNRCTLPRCGDGIAQPGAGEGCDDGNSNNDDGCTVLCQPETCGDGFLNGNEDCDDGADGNDSNLCLDNCRWSNFALLGVWTTESAILEFGHSFGDPVAACGGTLPFSGGITARFNNVAGTGGSGVVLGTYQNAAAPGLGTCSLRATRTAPAAPFDIEVNNCSGDSGFRSRAIFDDLSAASLSEMRGHFGNTNGACGRITWSR